MNSNEKTRQTLTRYISARSTTPMAQSTIVGSLPGPLTLFAKIYIYFIGYTPNATVVGCSRFVLPKKRQYQHNIAFIKRDGKNSLSEKVIIEEANIISITSIKTRFLPSKPKHLAKKSVNYSTAHFPSVSTHYI